ncbi:unnamed protein product [Cyprideis torosa]|uniref:protein-glutamate methylesterase n=1 Tax=Cyprideis torosa TaxID=163714 RepID=A0A7R8WIG8_9CRUS|nr:unnamed protein product [Cyprideis torosa]CAG0897879.1 unnamed protein product [Cyprideis torosa]
MGKKIRVLVVDDTIVYRKTISDIISEIPEAEVVGVAHNGSIAMKKIQSLQPDLLTLDIEMPEMNGLEVLAALKDGNFPVAAIMLSTLTERGSAMTMRALELGAFDFLLKPRANTLQEGKDALRKLLIPLVKAFSRGNNCRVRRKTLLPDSTSRRIAIPKAVIPPTIRTKAEIIAIGISTGGPSALAHILPQLPVNLGVPILIVQHMPPVFTKSLAESLDKKCRLSVKEACNGDIIQANTVYIAPGGRQMKVKASDNGNHRQIRITDDPPENSCKPSVDYLFRSVADYYLDRTTSIIMTGMGSDGTEGLKILKKKGSYIIAQDQASCVVYGMPKMAIEAGLADAILPLDLIPGEIIKSTQLIRVSPSMTSMQQAQ